jgi:hypothetical protein
VPDAAPLVVRAITWIGWDVDGCLPAPIDVEDFVAVPSPSVERAAAASAESSRSRSRPTRRVSFGGWLHRRLHEYERSPPQRLWPAIAASS